jgi:hypothetical protein
MELGTGKGSVESVDEEGDNEAGEEAVRYDFEEW